jgi:hypothetical protein
MEYLLNLNLKERDSNQLSEESLTTAGYGIN